MPDTKEAHYPPPWTYTLGDDRNPYNGRLTAADGELLVLRAIMTSKDDATMRLLAAAPAMLEVLLEIREDLLCGGECRHIPSGVQGSILSAISDALGEPADRTHLVKAVKKHALANYETDGWDYLVECWEDKDILECITGATTEEQAIQACLETVKLMDERRREVQSDAF